MNDLPSIIEALSLNLFAKIAVLILLFLYILFALVIFLRVRSLNRVIIIADFHTSSLLQLLVVIHFFLALSLFLIALVIL